MAKRIALSLLLTLCSLGCGGGGDTDDTETGTDDSAGAEAPAPEPQAANPDWGEESATLSALVGQPNITVYVNGPDRMGSEPIQPGSTADFETDVWVVNTGGGAFQVEEAVIRFEVWYGEGQRTPCVDTDDTTPPATIGEDEAKLHRGVARCEFPDPGEYEVHTYVGFDGEELVGDFDLQRHYAGRTELTVGG